MTDLTDPKWLWLKGFLFLVLGAGSSALLLAEAPSAKVAVLLALCIWSFSRAYYFAFYVIERYIDPGFRFAGLGSLIAYALRRKKPGS